MYTIYKAYENRDTHRFNGYELLILGSAGLKPFPGRWDVSEAKRHYVCGVPWDRPLEKETHTCIVNLDGKYYALGHDLFMTTIYAIGSDRIHPDRAGKPLAVYFEGGIEERNKAIREACIPHDHSTAVAVAKNSGIYDGELYNK